MSLLRESWQATGEGTDALLQAAREVRMCESAHIDMRWEAYELEIGLMRHGLVLPDRRIEVGEYMIEHVAPSVDIDRQVTLHQRLALTMREFGRLVDAIPHHMEALRLAEAVSVERRANLLLGLSAHYSHLGDFRRAAELAVEAETLLENEPDLLLARILARQAQIIEQQATLGEIDSLGMAFGLAQGERARDMIAAVDDESARLRHGSFAEVTVSRMLAALGRDDEAADAARAAAEYAREAGNSRLLMQRLVMQADIEITRGGYREARDILEEVLDLVGPDPAWAGRAHLLFGRVHLALEDSTLAAHHFQEAIASVEAQRADLGVTEWSLLRLSLHDSAYRDYAGLLLQQGRDEEAFGWLDAERARYLRDVRRLARLRDDEETFSLLAAELRSVEDSIRIAGARHSLELSTRRTQLQAQMARLTGYEPIEPQVDLPAMQRRLSRDGRVLVSYFLGTPAHAFVVSAEAFQAVPLPATREGVVQALEDLRLPDDPEVLLRGVPQLRPEPLRRLYELLFAPVEHLVPPGSPVTVVTDIGTGEIPFPMLLSGEAEPYAYEQWPYLIYRNAFSTELAAALLLEEPSQGQGRWPVVAFGRSDFSGEEALLPFWSSALVPLPNVPGELRSIRRQVSGSVIALDRRARETDLYDLLPEARILHLASHSFVSQDLPLYNAVILSPDASASGPEADGVLYLYELAGRHLDADLVVLSGCSTARGQARLSEGIIGLHYGFRAAGARASIATLWPVEDSAMATVMTSLYRHLARGVAKDEALRAAQLDYLRGASRERANPFYWAAPVLSGDPSPVDLGQTGLPLAAWWMLGSILLLAGVLLSRSSYARHHG